MPMLDNKLLFFFPGDGGRKLTISFYVNVCILASYASHAHGLCIFVPSNGITL